MKPGERIRKLYQESHQRYEDRGNDPDTVAIASLLNVVLHEISEILDEMQEKIELISGSKDPWEGHTSTDCEKCDLKICQRVVDLEKQSSQ